MQHLPTNTLLQGGKYKIERVLGQGGFGITYLATQVGLNRKVAIKEFFMREYCNRDTDTSHVTVGSEGSRDVVEKFRSKFVKEAQNIACLKHPHIISIHDVFEENGTAYYVMEYLDHGSLAELVKQRGRLSETDALSYIRQIADALRYIHARKMNHLDVKPGNILIDETDGAVLIDFGLSKRYDDEGNQTSTTPVGISHGYAPLEQYKKGGVGTFSPSTDIYSLGATLYRLVTGETPPDANDVNDEGLPAFPSCVPPSVAHAIEQAMQPRRKDRPQSVDAFLALLDADAKVDDERTVLDGYPLRPSGSSPLKRDSAAIAEEDAANKQTPKTVSSSRGTSAAEPGVAERREADKPTKLSFGKKFLFSAVVCILTALAIIFFPESQSSATSSTTSGNKKTYTVNGVSFTMVRVAGGTFTMGASSGDIDADSDEKPAHQVTLSSYSIGETEVTQALWQAVMGSNPSHFTGKLQRPVERVSWNECQAFIRKLNSLTGATFRLPTEAEWEYAARGGSQSRGYKYSGSDNLGTVAWYDGNSFSTTHPVKGKQPNELGIYDMSGNVSEWCADWFDGSYYANSPSSNPKGLSAGSYRVYRGGSWGLNAGLCRVSNRSYSTPSGTFHTLGLRLVSQ